MGFNGKAIAWINREKWKCEHIDLFGIVQTTNGKRKNHYNYMSGINKRIWDLMIKDLVDNGVKMGDIPKLLSESGLSVSSIQRKMTGHEETHFYEMEHILRAANYEFRFGTTEREIFRVARRKPIFEISEELDRIIVTRNLYPKFFINFKAENPQDMEIDFGKKTLISKVGINKMTEYVLQCALKYYENETPKEIKKLTKIIRDEVRRQFLNDEIIVKNKNY